MSEEKIKNLEIEIEFLKREINKINVIISSFQEDFFGKDIVSINRTLTIERTSDKKVGGKNE